MGKVATEATLSSVNDNTTNISSVLDARLAKQNALIAAIVRENMPSEINWAELEDIANQQIFGDVYEFGDQFVDTWTDKALSKDYTVPWNYVHSQSIELADGEILPNRPLLQCHYVHPFGVQFSHYRAFLKCPDGLAANTYTIHFEKSWSKCTQLDWYFTIANDVPAGGRIAGFYNLPDYANTGYKVYVYSADGKTILETVEPVAGTSGTDLGTLGYTARNGNLNCMQEMAYGYNRWKYSALRQYLNSASDVGGWWTAQDEFDIAPDELTTKAGFLSGCSEAFINAIKPFKQVTYANTVNDGGVEDITYDKVTLPSLQQMYIKPQISGEGDAFEYWMRRSGATDQLAQYGTYPNLITYAVDNHTSPQFVTLRSAYLSFAFSRWYVNSSGYVTYGYARSALRFAPLVAL